MVLPNLDRAFEIQGSGIIVNDNAGNRLYWSGAGADDPSQAPGISAPIGSDYTQISNAKKWVKSGPADTDWTEQGLVTSTVTSQTADFGTQGNANEGSYLDRAGGVPSNIVGIPIMLQNSVLTAVAFHNELTITGDIWIQEHDGVTFTTVYTLSVTASNSATVTGLNVPVTSGLMLAVTPQVKIKNAGLTCSLRGQSL